MIFTGSEHYIFYAYNYKPSPGLKGQWHCPPNPLGFPSVPSERVFLFLTVFLLRISLGSFSFIFLLFVSVSIPASEGWWLRVIGISLTDLFSTCTLSQWFATLVLNSCLLFHKAASLLLLFLTDQSPSLLTRQPCFCSHIVEIIPDESQGIPGFCGLSAGHRTLFWETDTSTSSFHLPSCSCFLANLLCFCLFGSQIFSAALVLRRNLSCLWCKSLSCRQNK